MSVRDDGTMTWLFASVDGHGWRSRRRWPRDGRN